MFYCSSCLHGTGIENQWKLFPSTTYSLLSLCLLRGVTGSEIAMSLADWRRWSLRAAWNNPGPLPSFIGISPFAWCYVVVARCWTLVHKIFEQSQYALTRVGKQLGAFSQTRIHADSALSYRHSILHNLCCPFHTASGIAHVIHRDPLDR